jgi:hypothetical protein
MKKWLGNGEFDIDLMLRLGVLTDERLVTICETLIDSPWYKGNQHEQATQESNQSVQS